jgi:hypothetical protein
MAWRSKNRKVRDIGVEVLQFVDGIRSAARWTMVLEANDNNEHDLPQNDLISDDCHDGYGSDTIVDHTTPFTRKPSGRSRGRPSMGEDGGES